MGRQERCRAVRDRAWPPGAAAREQITWAGSWKRDAGHGAQARRRRAYGVAEGADGSSSAWRSRCAGTDMPSRFFAKKEEGGYLTGTLNVPYYSDKDIVRMPQENT